MTIGILTFHWATNYGAVLQCYALQCFLESLGHEVKVIDYKPRRYDDSFRKFLYSCKKRQLREYFDIFRKEKALVRFRKSHLNMTRRLYVYEEIPVVARGFDAIISGSDQVLSPFFLMNGDEKGKVTPAYFLGFPYDGIRIGYALSFGCVTYPEDASKVAAPYVNAFDHLSVREATGVGIVRSMGRKDVELVQDPTLLMNSDFYKSLADEHKTGKTEHYVYAFFIRNVAERKTAVNEVFGERTVLWNNEDGNCMMQGWLSKIAQAESVVTDSFHCMVMCLKLHKPFVVVTEEEGLVGMNDRFCTLLGNMGLSGNIVFKSMMSEIRTIVCRPIDWRRVDAEILRLKSVGESYLRESLS